MINNPLDLTLFVATLKGNPIVFLSLAIIKSYVRTIRQNRKSKLHPSQTTPQRRKKDPTAMDHWSH